MGFCRSLCRAAASCGSVVGYVMNVALIIIGVVLVGGSLALGKAVLEKDYAEQAKAGALPISGDVWKLALCSLVIGTLLLFVTCVGIAAIHKSRTRVSKSAAVFIAMMFAIVGGALYASMLSVRLDDPRQLGYTETFSGPFIRYNCSADEYDVGTSSYYTCTAHDDQGTTLQNALNRCVERVALKQEREVDACTNAVLIQGPGRASGVDPPSEDSDEKILPSYRAFCQCSVAYGAPMAARLALVGLTSFGLVVYSLLLLVYGTCIITCRVCTRENKEPLLEPHVLVVREPLQRYSPTA